MLSCKATFWTHGRASTKTRCHYEGKRDGFCGFHHPEAIAKRKAKQDQRISDMLKRMNTNHEKQDRIRSTHERVYDYLKKSLDPEAMILDKLLRDDGVIQ
jgi:hypothetical protein